MANDPGEKISSLPILDAATSDDFVPIIRGKINGRMRATVIGAANVTAPAITTALGYVPYNAANPSGYVTSAYVTKAAVGLSNVDNKSSITIRGEGGSALIRSPYFFMNNDGMGNPVIGLTATSAIQVDGSGVVNIVQDSVVRAAFSAAQSTVVSPLNVAGALTEGGDRVATLPALAESTGGTKVAFQQLGTGAILRNVQNKIAQDSPQTVRDRGAVGDGTTNDRAPFVACDVIGAFVVPPGMYRIPSNITFANHVTFAAGARLVIPTGVTVTFNGGLAAPSAQIFNFTGTGAVAGLSSVDILWFVGDAWNNPSRVDGRALAQKAYDACVSNAVVQWPTGYLKHDGTAITVMKGQQTRGGGKNATLLLWTSTATNGFAVSTVSFASISGVGCSWGDYRLLPASGTFIRVSAVLGVSLDDIGSYVAYDAVTFDSSVAACTVTNSNFFESFNAGVTAQNAGDIFLSNFIINTNLVYVVTGAATGTFQVGEQVKGLSSLKQGPLQRIDDTTMAVGYVGSTPQVFSVGETIQGITSGATATITSARIPHASGGIRLADHVEAFIAESGDIIGGQYPMVSDAASNTQFNRPAYCSFTDVYFDSGIYGCAHNNSIEFDFVGCWWSNRSNGAVFSNCDGFKFNGGKLINNAVNGHQINATCTNFVYSGVSFRGNSVSSSGLFNGLLFKAGASKFIVTGCIGDDSALGYGTQAYAVNVEAGASDRYQIVNNRFTSAQLNDGGTGVNKLVSANF